MKDQIVALASDPVQWKALMMEARKQLGRASGLAASTADKDEENNQEMRDTRTDTAPAPTTDPPGGGRDDYHPTKEGNSDNNKNKAS
jgi:hypothetical protein